MIRARLIKQLTDDPRDVWWLELEDSVGWYAFHLAQALDSQTLIQKAKAVQAHKFVIDLTTLSSFDSHGLQLLLMLYKQLSDQDIMLVLHNPNYFLQRILRILQIDRFLQIETDERGKDTEGGQYRPLAS